MKGNPNPSPETRFKPGQSGNPGGKTPEQRRLEIENAEKASKIRGRLLDAVLEATDGGAIPEQVEAALLKLLKDSEDRGLGAPEQPLTGPEGAPLMPTQMIFKAPDVDGND